MTRRFSLCSLIALFMTLLLSALESAAVPVVVFSHVGATDPVDPSEGWTRTGAFPGVLDAGVGLVEVGPLVPDPICGGCGLDAWGIDDRSATGAAILTYEQVPTISQLSDARADGWTLRAEIRVASLQDVTSGAADVLDSAIVVEYSEAAGGRRYGFELGATDQGQTIVRLLGETASTVLPVTITDYGVYELVYFPTAASVTLFVDGSLLATGVAGLDSRVEGAGVYWGSVGDVGRGRGHFARVEWEVGLPDSSCDVSTFEECVIPEIGAAVQRNRAPPAELVPDGPTGTYLRLTQVLVGSNNNLVAFAELGSLATGLMTYVFDFSMTSDATLMSLGGTPLSGEYAADGFGVGLIDIATYGEVGDPGIAGTNWEDATSIPAFDGYYLSFDIFDFGGPNDNLISVRGPDNVPVSAIAPFVLNDDKRHRAYWTISLASGNATSTLVILEDVHGAAIPHPVFVDTALGAAGPAVDFRAFVAARNGGLTHSTELDNVAFLAPTAASWTVDFSGTIDSVTDPMGFLDPSIQVGSSLAGSYAIDLANVDSLGTDSGAGSYYPALSSLAGSLSAMVGVESFGHPISGVLVADGRDLSSVGPNFGVGDGWLPTLPFENGAIRVGVIFFDAAGTKLSTEERFVNLTLDGWTRAEFRILRQIGSPESPSNEILATGQLSGLSVLGLSSVNVDFGTLFGLPAVGYGAAAGQPGLWNQAGLGLTALVDPSGSGFDATIAVTAGFGDGGTGPPPDDDDALLLKDNFYSPGGVGWSVDLSGIVPGDYFVFLYAPSNGSVSTGAMTVGGVALGSLPGDSASPGYPGSNLIEGTSWASTEVTVVDGTLALSGQSGGFSGLAGLQVVPAPEPAWTSSLAIGLVGLCLLGRRRKLARPDFTVPHGVCQSSSPTIGRYEIG